MPRDNILGSYWTLATGAAPEVKELCDHDIAARIEAAARAGFTGMGFWHTDLAHLRKTHGFAEVRRILDANGIAHIEVEWLNDWFYKDERRAASDEWRALLLDAAEALGASHIKVADLGNETVAVDEMAEEFAGLCAEARERGTNVLFEMLPADFSSLPSVDRVLRMTRTAGAANGGVMLDNLHVQRTNCSAAELREKLLPSDLLGVEINDGQLVRPVHFKDSVINRRLLPGDGEFDIAGFLQAVWSVGYDGPIGVEVINEYLREWPLEQMAQVSFAKTAAVIEAARAAA
jgi:sugar phosphate isomerase/epimerase